MIEKLNNENNILNKYILPFFILLLFILLNTVIVFNFHSKNKEKKDILRLHIVANSDTIEDQIIKLKVENHIQDYINEQTKFENIQTKKELINNVTLNSNNLLNEIDNILYENNVYYKSIINVGKIKYEVSRKVKYYGNLNKINPKKAKSDNSFYIEIPKEIMEASKISLIIDVRNKSYEYIVR